MEQGVEFQGRMLRVARQARLMTQSQVAKASDITQPFISMLEEDERKPSLEQLKKLVSTLGFPASFFAQSFPIIGPGVGEIYHRRRKLSNKQLDSYYAWINIKIMATRRMLQAIDWPEVNLPQLSLDIDVATEAEAAAALRARWYVPRGPIKSIAELLDLAGILVIPEKFDHPEMDGTSVWLSDMPPMIYVNRDMTQDRLRFTLMHEVGHLILHQRSVLREVSDDIESQAHQFASAFLMPADEIKPQLRDLSFSKLADLKRYWRVSMSSLVMRARELEVISPANATGLWRDLSKRGWMKREPEQLDIHGEFLGGLYEELVNLHLKDLGFTFQQFDKFIRLNHEDVLSRILPPSQTQGLRIVTG